MCLVQMISRLSDEELCVCVCVCVFVCVCINASICLYGWCQIYSHIHGHIFGHACVWCVCESAECAWCLCVCVWSLSLSVVCLSLCCHSALQEELGASQTLQDLDALARRIPQRNSFLPNQELVPPPTPPLIPTPAHPPPSLFWPSPASSHLYMYFTSICIVHVQSIGISISNTLATH
jgi:hypothetical protein